MRGQAGRSVWSHQAGLTQGCKYLAQELGGEFVPVDQGHFLDQLFGLLSPPPGKEPPCRFWQGPVGQEWLWPWGLNFPAVLARTHPTGLTGSLSRHLSACTTSQEVVCLGNISSPEAEEQKDRCSASNLEESPVLDAIGKSCKSHLPQGEGALCQDHSLDPPQGPHPLCNWRQRLRLGWTPPYHSLPS